MSKNTCASGSQWGQAGEGGGQGQGQGPKREWLADDVWFVVGDSGGPCCQNEEGRSNHGAAALPPALKP